MFFSKFKDINKLEYWKRMEAALQKNPVINPKRGEGWLTESYTEMNKEWQLS